VLRRKLSLQKHNDGRHQRTTNKNPFKFYYRNHRKPVVIGVLGSGVLANRRQAFLYFQTGRRAIKTLIYDMSINCVQVYLEWKLRFMMRY